MSPSFKIHKQVQIYNINVNARYVLFHIKFTNKYINTLYLTEL